MKKGRLYFWIVVGMYLAYLGFGLVRDSIVDKPDNYLMFGAIGVIFLILGIGWAGYALKRLVNHEYEEYDYDPDENDEESDTIETDDLSESTTEINTVKTDNDSGNEE